MQKGFYIVSGWQDSNLRPPAPKAGAITGLRYTPKRFANLKKFYPNTKRTICFAERKGFEPPVRVSAQLLSREPRSATPAPLQIFLNF